MSMQKVVSTLLTLLFALLITVEFRLIATRDLTFSQGWLFFAFSGLGTVNLFWGREHRVVPVVSLLLASSSVLLSHTDPEEVRVVGSLVGPPVAFVWQALLWLFSFVFVHLALIFPVPNVWLKSRRSPLILLYVPYAASLGLAQTNWGGPLVDEVAVFSLPVGLLAGLGIITYQYLFSLTPAEKNRLRVVLIGCLAGVVPAALAVLGREYLPVALRQVAFSLLPLFPVSLLWAIHKENFSEVGRFLQRLLVYSLTGAGMVAAFFMVYLVINILLGNPLDPKLAHIVISSTLASVVSYPLLKWSGSYISNHFYAPLRKPVRLEITGHEFRPIQPNPYIAGNPVRSPEMFFGREEEFEFIRTKLQGQRHGSVILLRGERKAGKTSILYHILNGRLGLDFATVLLDLQGLVVDNDAEFLQTVADRIRCEVAEYLGVAAPGPITSFLEFDSFMKRIGETIGTRRFVLMVDEYELLEDKVREARLSTDILGYLNSLLARSPWMSVILAGSQALDSRPAWCNLLGRALYRDVSFLARNDAKALICNPLRRRAFFEPGAVDDIIRLTNGHPFFTQVLCQTIVDVLNEKKSSVVEGRVVSESVARVLENSLPQLLYMWSLFSDSEKLVLSATAACLKRPEAYVSPERVSKFLGSLTKQFLEQLNLPELHMHFEQLRKRSLLDRDQTRYRFTLDLMRLWIQSEHSVWSVLSETPQAHHRDGKRPSANPFSEIG